MPDEIRSVPITALAELNPKTTLPSDTECSFIGMEDVSEDGLWITKRTRSTRDATGYTPFRDGDVLFAKITPCMENGKGAQVDGLVSGYGFGSTEFHVLRARAGTCSGYITHWTRAASLRLKAEAFMTGSAGQRRVQSEFFSAFEIPEFPLAEQRRIAQILDTADEAIRLTVRVASKLEELRSGLLHDLVTRGMGENGELGAPVDGLEKRSESSLASRRRRWALIGRQAGAPSIAELVVANEVQLGRGKVISAVDIERFPGAYPIYSSSASGAGEFGRYGNFMFDEPLITWSVDGGGRPFLRQRHRFSVTNVGGFLRILTPGQWDYGYVHALMEYQHARLTFDWQMKAHPSVIRDLYWFPRRPLDEQRRIAHTLTTATNRIKEERVFAEKLRVLKQGLTDDLLTGRVRVKVDREDAA